LTSKFSFQARLREENRGFALDEEVAPNGVTHGGYGYVDAKGDLIYIEYQKDSTGQV
jgi:hypothetical protein